MQCPYCGDDSVVLDSRQSPEGVRRRRSCSECKRRFTTYERIANPSIRVNKRNGESEPFEPAKLIAVLSRVCRERTSIQEQDIHRMARTIEADLVDEGVRSVKSSTLAERLLSILQNVDKLSYDRLAANYLDESGRLRLESPSAEENSDQLGLFPEKK